MVVGKKNSIVSETNRKVEVILGIRTGTQLEMATAMETEMETEKKR